jgi:hypothetical protein
MRNLLFVSIIIAASVMLTACANNSTTQVTPDNSSTIAAIVSATLTASQSALPTTEPTNTATLNPPTPSLAEWYVVPSYAREEDVEFLFKVNFDTTEWEIKEDSQSIYNLKRKKQYLSHLKLPQCAIIQTAGYGLSSDYSIEHGQKDLEGISFETTSVKLNDNLIFVSYQTDLNLGNPYGNIFSVGGSDECLKAGEAVLATLKTAGKGEITPTP